MQFNKHGFRIYCEETEIRIGDVVCLDVESVYGPTWAFRAMIVSGVEETEHGKIWTVSRPHCTIWAVNGNEKDAQPAVQFEHLFYSEEAFRKSLVAFVTGSTGRIDNRNRGYLTDLFRLEEAQ